MPRPPHTVEFGTLQKNGTLTNIRHIPNTSILTCPHVILVPSHYRPDNTCRCNDPTHHEMIPWGYRWSPTSLLWESKKRRSPRHA